MSVAEIQWQVTWFPPDKSRVTKTARDRAHAMEIASAWAEWNPLVETREVMVGDWEIVRERLPG